MMKGGWRVKADAMAATAQGESGRAPVIKPIHARGILRPAPAGSVRLRRRLSPFKFCVLSLGLPRAGAQFVRRAIRATAMAAKKKKAEPLRTPPSPCLVNGAPGGAPFGERFRNRRRKAPEADAPVIPDRRVRSTDAVGVASEGLRKPSPRPRASSNPSCLTSRPFTTRFRRRPDRRKPVAAPSGPPPLARAVSGVASASRERAPKPAPPHGGS